MKIFALALLLLAAPAGARQSPCDAPENAQFDFWLGTWEVHANGQLAGRNVITKIHDGCTLQEEYAAAGSGYAGKSFNWYDAQSKQWRQVWVDSGGTRLDLRGGLTDGSMVLVGERVTDQGTVVDRITWTPRGDGTVRQRWELSADGGETWRTLFDGVYKKAEGTSE